MKQLLVFALALAACGKSEPKITPAEPAPAARPTPAPAPAPAPVPKPAPTAPTPAVPASPAPLKERPGGPTIEACERAADHLRELVVEGPEGLGKEQRAYVDGLLNANRTSILRYCLEVAVPKEIACVTSAKAMEALAGCENLRREIPEELVMRTEVTEADCSKFFDRLRQFKIAEGTPPADMDRDRDQIVRTCQERAKPGTIACFVASRTYEQARRCP